MAESPKKKMKFSNNKGRHYAKSQKEQFLMPGMQGFMATCNFREKDCVREAYNILNHYADEQKELEEKKNGTDIEEQEDAGDDIADQLDKEVNAAKSNQRADGRNRFKNVETGANNCIFIRSTIPDPVELASRIVKDIKSSGEQKTRFLLRLIPIEAVCRIDQIDSTAGKLFDKHFLKEGSTFSVVFNRRFNHDVKRDKIIADLAELVHCKNAENRVDLKNPEKTIVVEIIKGLCLMGVVPGYIQNKKYNLVELANLTKSTEANNGEKTVSDADATKEDTSIDQEKTEKKDDEIEDGENIKVTPT